MKIYKSVLDCWKNQKKIVSRSSQSGLTTIEYAIAAALLAAGLLLAFGALSNQMNNVFIGIAASIG